MKELYLIAYVIVPVFLLMMMGYFMGSRKIVSAKTGDELNKLVFKYFLPANLFLNIYDSALEDSVNSRLLFFCVAGILVIFALTCILVPRFEKAPEKSTVIIHAMFRSNYVIFGLVIISDFYPKQAGVAGVVSAVAVPLVNLLGVFLLEKNENTGKGLGGMIKSIAKNPLIIAAVLAVLCQGFHVTLPKILYKTVGELSRISTPLALLAIGMKFEFSSIRDYWIPMSVTLFIRLAAVPAVMCGLGVLSGFRDVELMTILILFGSPTAVATYTISKQYRVEHALANLLVVSTTLGCIVSLFVFLTVMTGIGLFVF